MEAIQGVLNLLEHGEVSKPRKVFLGFEFEVKGGGKVIVRKIFGMVHIKGTNVTVVDQCLINVLYDEFIYISNEEDALTLFETTKAQYSY
jgi:hypothetical protein